MIENIENPKLFKDDRILVLEPINGKAVGVDGKVDRRLFTGEQNIHLIRGKNNIWSVRYDKGTLPPSLNKKFTSFAEGRKYIEEYFKKRNVRIAHVID